ncbi:MAG TPA: hypothetical protein VM141_05845, partial [Planctomycetota bacterium]|nr:hypothetical protein [Planctomycetota bacterium]
MRKNFRCPEAFSGTTHAKLGTWHFFPALGTWHLALLPGTSSRHLALLSLFCLHRQIVLPINTLNRINLDRKSVLLV